MTIGSHRVAPYTALMRTTLLTVIPAVAAGTVLPLGAQSRPQPGVKLPLSQVETQMFHVSAATGNLISESKSKPGVWFATHEEIARSANRDRELDS
jgi:hypothetical protein